MGLIRTGLPSDYIEKAQKDFGFDIFIETGTNHADTSLWASKIFKKVYTIEAYKPLYDEVTTKYGNNKNINFIYGNSKDKLTEVITLLDKPAVFWLDAHYSGEGTFGADNKCPVVDEIIAVNKSNQENIILIDDAWTFFAPTTISHTPYEWPNIVEIISLLNQVSGRYIIILEDVIFAVPIKMKNLTARYAQKVNSLNNFINTKNRDKFKKLLKFALKKLKF